MICEYDEDDSEECSIRRQETYKEKEEEESCISKPRAKRRSKRSLSADLVRLYDEG